MRKAVVCLLIAMLFIPYLSTADELEKPRYEDTNDDGINDLFRDADGNGKNDVTGNPYNHNFEFNDSDNDGINDLFRDANGDGINDLVESSEIKNFKEITYYVIDYNKDSINDVTGEKYARKLIIRTFIDENGDGIDDRKTLGPVKSLLGKIMGKDENGKDDLRESMDGLVMDRFVDENADGINDGRTFNERLTDSFSK